VKRDFLYFNHNNNRALHQGDWKLVATGQAGPRELYDTRTDRCERNDLAAVETSRTQQMATFWHDQDALYVKQREGAAPSSKPLMPNRA
jgi:arylsulfatase A-like enzyme